MTTIKASCPTCGEVELTPPQTCPSWCAATHRLSYYAFTCATCCEEIRKPADDHVVSLLVSGGVMAEQWVIPAEALEEHHGARDHLRRRPRLRPRAGPRAPARGDDQPPRPGLTQQPLTPAAVLA